ncbi:cell wall hydrolase [Acetobacter senegalensis]|uniref:cell wall hydrolase n=1 Tax=Acetobacter senegalensis TaxID=446692 RepID=UPI001EDB3BF5|nr:cell wall hydrolase [Acetobacter senegalensis]MCG4256953.1 cell wall hydrolase [Acetobacter senegalensis]MCG4266909.1 cell wall hydrolase [Acetobacter senegalensis]
MQLPITDPVQAAARTAWGEARGEGSRGMQAVLNVIANRAAHPGWWGHDIASVSQMHTSKGDRTYWQFSCWDETDPNRSKLLTVADTDPQFREALVLAGFLAADHLPDLTGGADHYYDRRAPAPYWARGRYYKCTIGHHAFYRVGLRGDGN